MEEHGYLPVNNEKTIFMKWDEDDFIIHGVFVDDFATIPTSQRLKEEFETLYARDFEVTGGGAMTSFLGLEVEQDPNGIGLPWIHTWTSSSKSFGASRRSTSSPRWFRWLPACFWTTPTVQKCQTR